MFFSSFEEEDTPVHPARRGRGRARCRQLFISDSSDNEAAVNEVRPQRPPQRRGRGKEHRQQHVRQTPCSDSDIDEDGCDWSQNLTSPLVHDFTGQLGMRQHADDSAWFPPAIHYVGVAGVPHGGNGRVCPVHV